ncbi:galactose 1-dehydrogenase [Sphingomonas oleivorans]|uniref:Galactose 1-dehydrogenase n=1 Tax=Sphingomonas oleivorans TaxID=1735121 RepID=A0A2T5G1S4_9SPHN|nr:Gfo/Idh/MocA family oxidoreductase [Sphingomonas oleivorans]PTQ13095.1 galactose 1-dehydrogenase [Sphingomonas oleivorans]
MAEAGNVVPVAEASRVVRMVIVGVGKIARDQHDPAIAADDGFELAALVSHSGSGLRDLPRYATLGDLLRDGPPVDAIAICTPPQVRSAIALPALAAGLHVMLEKPPAATLSDFERLRVAADTHDRTLFATWHSRHAPMVAAAKAWLAGRRIARGKVIWRENVRQWHPGQRWLWQPGGLGVFDPGINALSILTEICPEMLTVEEAAFETPANAFAPIGARLTLQSGGADIAADFDFRQTGEQSWNIHIETDDGGTLALTHGGSRLSIDGEPERGAPEAEYPGVYRRFAELIAAGRSDADPSPLRLVADAFLIARNVLVEPFEP